jgi:hypothetical protein
MAFLLRVALPDVPGSLGALATALGGAGADIEAIEIVERRHDGRVVDDVLLELPPQVMPDALVTACHSLEGVAVDWISRYNAGANLSMDLEAVERFTEDAKQAVELMVEVLPSTFRTDWAMALEPGEDGVVVRSASATAPELVPDLAGSVEAWMSITRSQVLDPVPQWDSTVLAAASARDRADRGFVVVVGRHGGPDFLASEVARLGHMVSLAASVQLV